MTLTFNLLLAMVMTYSHAKVQGQRSVGPEDRVETNGQTDEGNCAASLANAFVLVVQLQASPTLL